MKVLICDDQAIIRDGLEMLLKLEKDIEVIGQAQDGAEAVELVAKLQPELVLMDLKMPGMTGIEATRQIRDKYPHIKVLVLTTYDDDEWVFDAIRGTMAGKSFVDPAVAGKLLTRVAGKATQPASLLTDKLTERETDVLRLIARGFTNPDIAAELHLSEGTVRNHVSAIFAKLDVADRTQAAVIAIRHGLGA